MKELEKQFIGRGEVKGFTFTQIKQNGKGYIYHVRDTFGNERYEVFKRVENVRFNTISYPKSKSFGKWAWTTSSLEKAEGLFLFL